MADAGITLQVEKFNSAMREMKSAIGSTATMRQIVDYEVGRILERTLKLTQAATVASIRKGQALREWITINKKPRRIDNRYKPALHAEVKAAVAASLARHLAAQGITKQSFLTLAAKLGQQIDAPGYVAAATVPNHTNSENVTADRQDSNGKYGVRIANSAPLLRWTGAKQAFFSAVAGRQKFFMQNLRRGVFDQIRTVAKKYPGLVVYSS